MRLSKTFKVPIYNCDVYVGIVDDVRSVVNRFYRKNNQKFRLEIDEDPAGCFFSFDVTRYYIILSKEDLTHGFISHEGFHLVQKILKDRDLLGDEEAGAYLSGFIAESIYSFLNKRDIKIG